MCELQLGCEPSGSSGLQYTSHSLVLDCSSPRAFRNPNSIANRWTRGLYNTPCSHVAKTDRVVHIRVPQAALHFARDKEDFDTFRDDRTLGIQRLRDGCKFMFPRQVWPDVVVRSAFTVYKFRGFL